MGIDSRSHGVNMYDVHAKELRIRVQLHHLVVHRFPNNPSRKQQASSTGISFNGWALAQRYTVPTRR